MSRCFEKDERHVDAKVKIEKLNFFVFLFLEFVVVVVHVVL